MRVRIGRYRIRADGGHLAFATALTAFIAWYGYSTYEAARATADLLLILPGTVFMLLLYGLLLLKEIRVEGSAREQPVSLARGGAERSLLVKQWIYVGAMAGFLIVAPLAGIEIGSFAFTAATLWLLGSNRIFFNVALSAVFALFISYVFVHLLGLPIGSLVF